MSIAIKAENVSKLYRLGQIGTGSMQADLKRFWYKVRGKEDPFWKLGESNDRSVKGSSDYVWSLRDINFEIEKGDAVGIIGRNGAGKSTLLKLLSRVTAPTTGTIKARGRIASLLEVGTGFHPELTGRENIFINGAFLGMRKHEIKKHFDAIVDFSGVERYIDTPVKRYSSGMYVRLAFAVAAHLESEILIVDEVLAVGDAEFQKKCLGKMGDVSKGEGRTVLFVSHNMAAVRELCNNAILLKNGLIANTGTASSIVREYLLNPVLINSETDMLGDSSSRRGNGEIRFTKIVINGGDAYLDPQKDIKIQINAITKTAVSEAYFSLIIRGPENSEPITSTQLINIAHTELKPESQISFNFTLPAGSLRTGLFPVYFWLGRKGSMAEDNYPYDVLDSVYYLNLTSEAPLTELGYNSIDPGGYFNLDPILSDLRISEHA